MPHFSLTIHIRTGHFGETDAAERAGVARLLHLAAQEIGSGAAPTPLKDGGGHVIGSYEFGPGMICGPGKGFDETYRSVPSLYLGGSVPPLPAATAASAPRFGKAAAAVAISEIPAEPPDRRRRRRISGLYDRLPQ